MPTDPAKPSLGRRFETYFRVEPGELRPTLMLGCALMLGMATVICLKAVSDAVFLSVFDATRLPWVDLAVTLLVGAVVNFYLRWSTRTPIGRVIGVTQCFLGINLFAFWLMLRAGFGLAPPLIYIWVGVFAVLIPSQVWSLAATVFNTRQAKRLYALIGSGGILGAALGGSFAGLVGEAFGAEAVLLSSVGFVAASAGIAFWLTRTESAAAATPSAAHSKKASIAESFQLVGQSRYLLLITAAIFLSAVVGTLLKYQFKAIVQLHFEGNRADLASFSGYFYGYVAVVSFIFHTLFTARMLRWAGLSWCLFMLPLFLTGGLGVLLFSSSLAAAVFARGSDQSFRHSIDRASMELLYVPVPAELRSRVKSFLDMVVGRAADGLASVTLLVLVGVLAVETNQIAWVALAFLGVWVAALWQLKGEYLATLRTTIERKDLRAENLLREMAESGPSAELESILESSDPRDVEAAVGWIQFSGARAGQAQLASLLTHSSAAIRRKAMAAVASENIPGCEREALGFLEIEEDVLARWQALEYLERQDAEQARKALQAYLEHSDRLLAATVAAKLAALDGPGRSAAEAVFCGFIEEARRGDPSRRAAAALLLGLAPECEGPHSRIADFLADSEPPVVRAALKSVEILRPAGEIPTVLKLIADRRFSRESRHALAAYGESILETIGAALGAGGSSIRDAQLVRVAGTLGGARAAALVIGYLESPAAPARLEALRALERIRLKQPRTRVDGRAVTALLNAGLRRYYQTAFFIAGVSGRNEEGSRFLFRALSESLARDRLEIFILLGLIYPPKEMRDAYHWIISGRADLRSNALEFLDSRLLGNPLRPLILPAVEDGSGAKALQAGRELFGLRDLGFVAVLRELLDDSRTWLQACACYAAAEQGLTALLPRIEALAEGEDPLLRETARAARERIGLSG